MRRLAVALALVLSLSVAACGSGDDPTVDVPAGGRSTTSSSSTTTTEVPTGTPTSSSVEPDGAFGTEASLESEGYGHLVAVRHAQQEGFYRVVFEFRAATPGVRVEKVSRPVRQDGSGDEVAVAGDEVVLVTFEPSSSYDLDANEPSYDGPGRMEVERAPVVEIVRVSDFEAVLSWAIGVDQGARVRVTSLDGPPRVVVDLR